MEERSLIELLNQLAAGQRKKLLKYAEQIVPRITEEDLLQPFDFPELEKHPDFRHLEGVLEGILTVEAAILAEMQLARQD